MLSSLLSHSLPKTIVLAVSWLGVVSQAFAQTTVPPIPDIIPPKEVPRLESSAPYTPRDGNIVDVELSDYVGYAGFILSNNGLDAKEDSFFFKNFGFKVAITLSDQENWSAINRGDIGASGTTPDVLAVYADQLNVLCPALFSFSRGGNGLVVRSEIENAKDLLGKTVVASRYTDSDFFIRFLAAQNGIRVHMRRDLDQPPRYDHLNLVYTEQVDGTTAVFDYDLRQESNRYAGCVGLAPMTTELVGNSKGKARFFATTKNQLIIANVLILNRGFAEENANMAKGLVHGLLEGNRRINDIKLGKASDVALAVVAKALTTDAAHPKDVAFLKEELKRCDFSTLGLTEAFLEDRMLQGASFAGIFEEAVKAYELASTVGESVNRYVHLPIVKGLAALPEFAPENDSLKSIGGLAEAQRSIVMWKDVHFVFGRNVYNAIRAEDGDNAKNLAEIARYVRYSPGSILKLTGHLDDSEAKARGSAWSKRYGQRAIASSLARAQTIKDYLVSHFGLRESLIEVAGKGWDEPLGSDTEANRRVEVQVFSLE